MRVILECKDQQRIEQISVLDVIEEDYRVNDEELVGRPPRMR